MTKLPILRTPSPICIRPANMTMVNASPSVLECWVMMTAIATVIGGVGLDICVGVPPNTAAKKPTAMALYKPAMGPSPDAMPKANATGRATMAAVTPPNTSPDNLCKL